MDPADRTESTVSEGSKSPDHPLSGLGVAGVVLVLGLYLLLGPSYFNWNHWVGSLFYVLAVASFVVSAAGAGIEVAKLVRSKALEYWAVSLIFLIPAGVAVYLEHYASLDPPWDTFAKSIAYLGGLLGCAFVVYGIPYIFPDGVSNNARRMNTPKPGSLLATAGSIVVMLTSIVSAIAAVVALWQ